MSTKLQELTVEDLKGLISKAVRETMEEVLEDLSAKGSKQFLDSVQEAREDFREGRVQDLDDLKDA